METKLSIALLLILVTASTALPVEQRKCLPMLFKSDYLGQVGQVMNGKTMRFSVMGTAYYDIAHKKQVSMQLLKGDGFTVNQTYIVDDNTVSLVLSCVFILLLADNTSIMGCLGLQARLLCL